MKEKCGHDHIDQKQLLKSLGQLLKSYVDNVMSDEEANSSPKKSYEKTELIGSVLVNFTLNVICGYSADEYAEAFPMNVLQYISMLSQASSNTPVERMTND